MAQRRGRSLFNSSRPCLILQLKAPTQRGTEREGERGTERDRERDREREKETLTHLCSAGEEWKGEGCSVGLLL